MAYILYMPIIEQIKVFNMYTVMLLQYIQQGSRKIFNLWVLSGKAEDQKKEKRSQADSNGSIYSTNSTIFITT